MLLQAINGLTTGEKKVVAAASYHADIVKQYFSTIPCESVELVTVLNTALLNVNLSVSLVNIYMRKPASLCNDV